MFGMTQNPAAAYAQIGVDTMIQSADPHRLIVMLFEGARTAISMARLHMEHNEIPEKGAAISQAIDIINNGLLVSLDIENGGELAERLAALYEYISQRLLWANLKNNVAALDEANQLLGELQSAWVMIARRLNHRPPQREPWRLNGSISPLSI
ncbi:MAG: flagellar export chaperone FliS [Propionivibrio sp.]|uniref:Flagellar secretion chaperone FliS n=1 Tax=Candidatus Propionivibrio dominans TaxID=2954373 RepID=A0A9D7FIS7_9RHOO|nr:flagellar export chaperone FliS [Candidatus Propionivibrio dominans]